LWVLGSISLEINAPASARLSLASASVTSGYLPKLIFARFLLKGR